MKNYNFASFSYYQPPFNPGFDEFQSNNQSDISMMMGNCNLSNVYLGDGDGAGFNHDNVDFGSSIDVSPPFPYFSPAMENIGIGASHSLLDYPWNSPFDTTKNDTPYIQSCKPTIKDVRKSVNGAKLGQRNNGFGNVTSLDSSRTIKKRKAIEQLIHSQKLKGPGRKSQKLSDKITALQELVSPYGKTDTASVLQEACFHIKIIHNDIQRLCFSYFEGRAFQAHLQGGLEKGDLKSRGLCLVPVSIMKKVTKQIWDDQHQTAGLSIRRPDMFKH